MFVRLAGELERDLDVLIREKKLGVKLAQVLSAVFEREKPGVEAAVEVEARGVLVGLGEEGDIVFR